MARTLYGMSGGEVIAAAATDPDVTGGTGKVLTPAAASGGTTFQVMTARTGGTQLTDLQNLAGSAITTVSGDADGRIYFFGPDGTNGTLWLRDSANTSGVRYRVDPVDLADRVKVLETAGTSGMIPATIVDAKGDIVAATAADTVARLPVGANGTVLTADSTTSTGLSYTAKSSTTGLATVADGLAQFPDVSDTAPTDGQIYVYDFTDGELIPVDLDSVAAPLGPDGRLAVAVRPKYYRNIIVINEGDPLPADASVNDIVFSRPAAASIVPILLGSQFNNGTNATSSAGLVITTTADAAVGTWMAISFMQSAEVSPALTDVSTTVGLSAGAVSGGFTLDAGSKVTIGATAQTGWLYGKVTTLIPSGSTITVKPTSTTRAEMSVTALAVPNLVSATPVDKQGTGSGNSVTAPANVASTATGTTTQAHEMALAVVGYNSGNPQTRTVAVQSGQGWTPATAQIVSTAFGGASHGMLTAYQELNAAGTASAKFTITDTAGAPATGQWCISVITLKAA